MAVQGTIDRFFQAARRRHWVNLTLEAAALGAAFGAAGLLLLLLLGTQIFDWHWPAILFAAALAAGLVRARRSRLSAYRLAQRADAQLGLQDRLSTVVFFREVVNRSAPGLETVERQASGMLADSDAKRAVPIGVPRYGYASIALLAAAAGLLGVRYGLLRSLDLSAPIAQIEFGAFQEPAQVHAATRKSVIQERFEEQLRQLGLNVEDPNRPEGGEQGQEANVASAANPGGDQKQPPGVRQVTAPQEAEEGEAGENGEQSQGEGSDEGAPSDGSKQEGKPQTNPQNAKNSQPGAQDSLMNKMRDALANLMNKLKMPSQSQGQQSASQTPSPNSSGKQQSNEQGMQSRSKSDGQGQPNSDQQGDQDGDGEKMAGDQSRTGDRSNDKPGDQDSKTGMGRQDGSKDIQNAEQLAAMGKISEIFGKRAQQITGEMTVEVSSGKQHLKTAYTERRAAHADTGAEVSRDEIPLAYQTYIQRYYEEVRKTAKVKN